MEHSPCWEANTSPSQETPPPLYETQTFITVFTTTATGPCPEPDASSPQLLTLFP
jgi:hypothetical protein